jgi:hypothetical protein
MPGIYDRRLFRMANGGIMPPPAPMGAPPMGPPPVPMGPPPAPMGAPPMGPAMGGEVPPGAIESAKRDFQELAQEDLITAVGDAVDEEVGRGIENLDGATDFRDIMNIVWEDDADIDAYRGKLAEVVGWEDADRTPDSVLALVQPTLQLAAIDQGIGALMQEELTEVEGLGGGIVGLATKSADGMAAETGALVDAVSGMAPTDRPAGAEGPPIDPMMLEAMMQGAGPMGQGMV